MSKNSVKGLSDGPPNLITGKEYANQDQNLALGTEIKKRATSMKSDLPQFAKEVEEARRLLEDCTDLFRADVLRFSEELPDAIKRVRDARMAISREKSLTLDALSDVRKFFLEKDHDEEMRRLRDFVSLCERLKKLSEDGTLEKVSEVMLKLEGV